MKNYLKLTWRHLLESLVFDVANRYLLITTIVLAMTDWIIWRRLLSSPDLIVYLKTGIYPVQILAIILGLNTFLAVSAYRREREISHLLFIGNIASCVLILILEIFYLQNA